MLLRKISVALVLGVLLTACGGGGGAVVVNDGIPAADSVSLQRVDTLTLHTGHGIKAIPTCSQLLDDSCAAKYIVLDRQKLNIFDLDADSLIAVVDVSECGGLQNYSGFHCAPDGKSYLYDYGNKTLSMVNAEGKVLNAYEIPDEVMKDVSPEPIDGSHIILTYNNREWNGDSQWSANERENKVIKG